jgi:hypothetical protein
MDRNDLTEEHIGLASLVGNGIVEEKTTDFPRDPLFLSGGKWYPSSSSSILVTEFG